MARVGFHLTMLVLLVMAFAGAFSPSQNRNFAAKAQLWAEGDAAADSAGKKPVKERPEKKAAGRPQRKSA